jgi:hypothetical protein
MKDRACIPAATTHRETSTGTGICASKVRVAAKKGEVRGIVVGNAKDGSLAAFIPDPADLDNVIVGSSASGIGADDMGNIYAADVGAHNLRKYAQAR